MAIAKLQIPNRDKIYKDLWKRLKKEDELGSRIDYARPCIERTQKYTRKEVIAQTMSSPVEISKFRYFEPGNQQRGGGHTYFDADDGHWKRTAFDWDNDIWERRKTPAYKFLNNQVYWVQEFGGHDWWEDRPEGGVVYVYQKALWHLTKKHCDLNYYTKDHQKLLVMQEADKERKDFERLKRLYKPTKAKETTTKRKPIPERVRISVWRRDEGKCVQCGSNELLEYDHIIPVSKGGSNTVRNIQLLCETCNRKKSDSI
jgi:hypothetical protein